MTNIERYYWIERAQAVQNHPANAMVDIVTFLGYCDSWEHAERHVMFYENRAGVEV